MEIKIAKIEYRKEGVLYEETEVRLYHERLQEYLREKSFSRFATLSKNSLDEMTCCQVACGLVSNAVVGREKLIETMLTWGILHTIRIAGEPGAVDKGKQEIAELYGFNFLKYRDWQEKICVADYNWYESKFVFELEQELSKRNIASKNLNADPDNPDSMFVFP